MDLLITIAIIAILILSLLYYTGRVKPMMQRQPPSRDQSGCGAACLHQTACTPRPRGCASSPITSSCDHAARLQSFEG